METKKNRKESETEQEEKKVSGGAEALTWIRDIVIAVVLALIIAQFVTPTIVQEHSMDDTLHNNDYLILWKAGFRFFGAEPQYGDIIVFRSEVENEDTGKNKLLIKRVIGKENDAIAIINGVVYRNGEALEEPYIKDGYTNGDMLETIVPEGSLFVMGDNRLVSLDSRSPMVGFVDEDTLVGKAVFRLFPFSDAGSIYKNLPQTARG